MVEIIVLLIIACALLLTLISGAPFVPTHRGIVKQIIAFSEIKPGTKFADLGSGDGRLVIAAALAGADACGFEFNPLLVYWSRYKIKKLGLKQNAKIYQQSFWQADLKDYDCICIFGRQGIMLKLQKKLQAELKPNARVISNIFKFPNWEPSMHQAPLYIYKNK